MGLGVYASDKSILIVKVLEHGGQTITIEPQFVRDYKSNFFKD
jgi:hypothetical protein